MTMSSHVRRMVLSPILFSGFILLLWEVICVQMRVSKFVVPRPSEIVPMYVTKWPVIWPNALQTLATTLVGFAIGVALGFLLGIALGASTRVYNTVEPNVRPVAWLS